MRVAQEFSVHPVLILAVAGNVDSIDYCGQARPIVVTSHSKFNRSNLRQRYHADAGFGSYADCEVWSAESLSHVGHSPSS
jgi:hypothetical protein